MKSWIRSYGVSIHTPTKGVTKISGYCYRKFKVSIHTPTKGVTYLAQVSASLDFGFNPHTHEGCDFTHTLELMKKLVSIHTPTKGVTSAANHCRFCVTVSIHTPTKGVTFMILQIEEISVFQSTHPRRV